MKEKKHINLSTYLFLSCR